MIETLKGLLDDLDNETQRGRALLANASNLPCIVVARAAVGLADLRAKLAATIEAIEAAAKTAPETTR